MSKHEYQHTNILEDRDVHAWIKGGYSVPDGVQCHFVPAAGPPVIAPEHVQNVIGRQSPAILGKLHLRTESMIAGYGPAFPSGGI